MCCWSSLFFSRMYEHMLHYSHMMKSWSNCAVCTVSFLSSICKRQMISLICYELKTYAWLSCWSFKMQVAFCCWPCLKIKAETPLMFNHSKKQSVSKCVLWHSFIWNGKYISAHLYQVHPTYHYSFHAEILRALFFSVFILYHMFEF